MKFRLMTASDEGAVIEMMRVFYRSAAVHTDGSEEIFLNDFNACVGENPYLEGYIFESDGDICGYAMLAKSFSTEFGKPCIWIEDIYIKESFRGRRIGAEFFGFIEDKYPNVLFRLEAEEENTAALRLYRKMGYEPMCYIELKK